MLVVGGDLWMCNVGVYDKEIEGWEIDQGVEAKRSWMSWGARKSGERGFRC